MEVFQNIPHCDDVKRIVGERRICERATEDIQPQAFAPEVDHLGVDLCALDRPATNSTQIADEGAGSTTNVQQPSPFCQLSD
jgi:hypothetical protein